MKLFRLQLVLLAGLTLAGCSSRRYYASGPPPPVRVETRFGAPGPGMIWINGYWGLNNRNYAWVPGRWARPPRSRAVWIAPRWEQQRNGRYILRNGRWR
ncbi:MAG: YXWGXW repeat-containing protein [Bryobacteraceae bacterium]